MYIEKTGIDKRRFLNETMSVTYVFVYSLKYVYLSHMKMNIIIFGIIFCMESNKTNLKLLYLGQINKKWLLSSNGLLQFRQSVLSDKKNH